jgi:mannose-6-phosphate isomerase-like protein (cupin superfamily)
MVKNIVNDDMESRIVRYGELKPCKTAFIDAHSPGSDQKENFTIIGGGVSESPNQHVHITIPHGFNIGAAGQPPKCRNSLHSHRTAEVFFVLSGRWRFFWGRWGNSGEVVLEKGDIINIPTGIFRGFENIGDDYGMIMAILGGNDAGGGVIWAPQVIQGAKDHGLVLSDKGRLFDTKKGEKLPEDSKPMPLLTEDELKKFPEPEASKIINNHVARYLDLKSLAFKNPANVIGENGKLRDKPGFEVDFLTENTKSDNILSNKPIVYMPFKGNWKITWHDKNVTINSGDTITFPENLDHKIESSMTGEAGLYRIIATDDPAGPTLEI